MQEAILIAWKHALLANGKSANTIRSYLHTIDQFFIWYTATYGAPLYSATVSLADGETYLNDQAARGSSPAALRHAKSVLRTFGAWLVETQRRRDNPFEKLASGATSTQISIRVVSDHDILALFEAAKRAENRSRDTALVRLFLETGLQAQEAAALTIDDLKIMSTYPIIQIGAGTPRPVRQLPISAALQEDLIAYLAERWQVEPTLEGVKLRLAHEPQGSALWQGKRGALSANSLATRIGTLGLRCGLTLSVQTLRDTFAVRFLLERPEEYDTLAAMLGYTRTRKVRRRYVDVVSATKRHPGRPPTIVADRI